MMHREVLALRFIQDVVLIAYDDIVDFPSKVFRERLTECGTLRPA